MAVLEINRNYIIWSMGPVLGLGPMDGPHMYPPGSMKPILIISPKFEISGMLWFWSGRRRRRRRRRIRRRRRRRRRTPHAKACVSRNCDTNARIKFIFDTAIDTLEWKNPIDFGENRKTKMAAKRPFCENMMKKLVHSINSSKMHRSTSYLI